MTITPPQAQLHVDPAVRAGFPPTIVRTAPGFHGVVTGTHGIGTNTPRAALVAAATVGFARLLHIANGAIFTMGAKSIIVAAGFPSIMTRGVGSGLSVDGANPKLHCSIAPSVAFWGIRSPFGIADGGGELSAGGGDEADHVAILGLLPTAC
jgi:hypothetical protein